MPEPDACIAMAGWDFSLMLVNQRIADVPIGYRPPVGQFRQKEHIHELQISQEVQPGAPGRLFAALVAPRFLWGRAEIGSRGAKAR